MLKHNHIDNLVHFPLRNPKTTVYPVSLPHLIEYCIVQYRDDEMKATVPKFKFEMKGADDYINWMLLS